jgi:hypothetical protein
MGLTGIGATVGKRVPQKRQNLLSVGMCLLQDGQIIAVTFGSEYRLNRASA